MKQELKRKGFTLVELLIVIVVIGVLSAMMMLSSTEAVSSAKASNIISNLRNMKTAVLSYIADHMDLFSTNDGKTTKITSENILPYLNKTSSTAETKDVLAGYWVINKEGFIYVACELTHQAISANTDEAKKIADKLAGRAKSTGIMFSNNLDGFTKDSLTYAVPASATKLGVVMWVR